MTFPKKRLPLVFSIMMVCMLCHGFAFARTLTVGQGFGVIGSTVAIPITLDDPAEVGGVAFTLTFPAGFSFTGLQKDVKAVDDGDDYPDPKYTAQYLGDTLFYQVNLDDAAGRVSIAAAAAGDDLGTTLFYAKFMITAGEVDTAYPIGIEVSTVTNPAAGYDSETELPVLVGFPADDPDENGFYDTPVFAADFVPGSITIDGECIISGTESHMENCEDGNDQDCDGEDAICDADLDHVRDADDNCPDTWNDDQLDTDFDHVGDDCDDFSDDPAASVDTDGDGYPDAWHHGMSAGDSTTGLSLDQFPGDPHEWADGDGDGVGDNADGCDKDPACSDQKTVNTIAAGVGVTLKVTNGATIDELEAVDPDTIADIRGERPDDMPFGLIRFKLITLNPGDEVIVTAIYTQDLSGYEWYKHDSAMGWTHYTNAFLKDIYTFELVLKDGGDGDADRKKNREIVDPSGPGALQDQPQAAGGGGGGGGGCFLNRATGNLW